MSSALTPLENFYLLRKLGWRHQATRAVAHVGYKAGLVSHGGSVPVDGPRIPYFRHEVGCKRTIGGTVQAAILTNEIALTSTDLHLFASLVLIPLGVL